MTETQMNELYNILVVNLYSKSKNEKGKMKYICLRDYDPSIELHHFYFCVSGTAQAIWGAPIYLNMNLFKFLKWKWKVRKIYKKVYWSPFALKRSVHPMAELTHVSEANGLDNSIWTTIYTKFFLTKEE